MSWLQTRDGHIVDLISPDISAVTIDEIAHALARLNRFAGHTRDAGYSVAEHSVHVAYRLNQDAALCGLMHDAHEAFMGDITSPVKMALSELGGKAALRALDQRLRDAVGKRFCLNADPFAWHDVHIADLRMLATERRDLLGPEAQPWNLRVDGLPVEPYEDFTLSPWDAPTSERKFLQLFEHLGGKP